jgi:hypothetical protein
LTLDTPRLVAGDGFVTDELWLVQYPCFGEDNENCCWVEVGVIAGYNGLDPTETHFFWADDRPGLGFLFRDFGLVPQNAFNQPMRLSIYRNMDLPDTFSAEVVMVPQFIFHRGIATGNSMVPNTAEIGRRMVMRSSFARWMRCTHHSILSQSEPLSDAARSSGEGPTDPGPPSAHDATAKRFSPRVVMELSPLCRAFLAWRRDAQWRRKSGSARGSRR